MASRCVKKGCEKARCNLSVPREQSLQSSAAAAAADSDDVVVSTAASPAFLHAARDARTRVPRLPHMSPTSACEHGAEMSECGCAVRARLCKKDVRSLARETCAGRKRKREKARKGS